MKNYRFWAFLLLSLVIFSVASAAGNKAKIFKFKARTWDSISNTTDRLNGEYEVVVVGQEIEVFQVLDGRRAPFGGNAGAEIARMAGIDPDDRMYVNPSKLAVGKGWDKSHQYQPPAWRSVWRDVKYKVISKMEKTTQAGTFETFKIEGNAVTRGTPQKWVYYYAPSIGVIVHWYHESAVGRQGGKIEIEFVGFGHPRTDK